MDKQITVTPNVEYSLKILEKAVKEMSEGDMKANASEAIAYLLKIAKQGNQAAKESECPPPVKVFPPG